MALQQAGELSLLSTSLQRTGEMSWARYLESNNRHGDANETKLWTEKAGVLGYILLKGPPSIRWQRLNLSALHYPHQI